MKNNELEKEIKALETIQKNQEKEMEKNSGSSENSTKMKALNDQLKSTKEKNKELEKKIQAESASYQKQHNHLLDLQEKLQQLKKEKIRWKKAIAEKLPCPPEENEEEQKKSEEDILKSSLQSLKRRLEIERATSKKTLEGLKNEITNFQMKIKEAEQENKLNTAKLAELKKMMRHNQLKPLNEPENEEIPEVYQNEEKLEEKKIAEEPPKIAAEAPIQK